MAFGQGEIGYNVSTSGNLFKTVNSGSSWTNMFTSGVEQIDFVNDSIGYYVSTMDNLFKTTDSGVSWANTYTGTVYYIDFVADSLAPVGFAEQGVDEGFLVYPNPATDIINCVLPDNEDYEIIIYDALSSIVILSPVEGRTIEDGQCTINHLPSSIYFIEARGEKVLWGRFLKE
jgi:hypothetical protein